MTKRFCKGASESKLPKPRYDFIWDSAPVIKHLKTIFPHKNYSLEIITKKLVLLLALRTGHRTQTLSLIKLSGLSLGNNLVIKIADRIKTRALGKSQPIFTFS